MLSRARTATKFFTYGLLLGVLFAPASGQDTRQRLRAWITRRGSEIKESGIGNRGD